MIGIGVAAVLAAVLGWAWYDGGEVPLTEISDPALLPKVGS